MCSKDTEESRLAIEYADPQIDPNTIELAIKLFLQGIGEDIEREGIRETPRRVARMWMDFYDRREISIKTFDGEDYDEMVICSVPFYAFCEHHILPFIGEAHIGYIPRENRVLGISKLARIMDHYALRLTLQERLTRQIAERICREIECIGVGVVIKAEHLCMSMRGVQKPGHITTTSYMTGELREDSSMRAEFLHLAGGRE